MSPGQFRSQVVQNASQPPSQNPVPNGGNISLQQRGNVPALPGRHPLVANPPQGHGATSAQAVTDALAQQLQQGLALAAHQAMPSSQAGSGNSSASSTPVPSGPRLTINISHPLPPPYSQASSQVRGGTPTLVHIQGEQSHMLGAQLTDYHLALAPADSPLNLSTASSSNYSDNNNSSSGSGMMTAGGLVAAKVGPVAANRCPMNPHAPIIMHSVKSKQVHKPVAQTATAPVSPSPPAHMATMQGHHSFVSQVKTKVNGSARNGQVPCSGALITTAPTTTTTTTTHTRNLQIHITGQAPHHVVHSRPTVGPQYATEPVAPQSGPTIQIRIPSGAPAGHAYPSHVHLHNFGGLNYDLYPRAPSDTISTPRSDSPVSRAATQSPLSVLSTTSSPSTNSDIPDKPPPPYPFGLHAAQKQPPLPPRVPLHRPPPPPPQTLQGVAAQQAGQPVASSPHPWTSEGQTSSTSQGVPLLPPANQNGTATGSLETASEQGEDTDTETVSSAEAGAASGGGGGGGREKHRCMSPIPQRKPEAWELDQLRRDTKVRNYSPHAFKFYMEQHIENVLKNYQQRIRRRTQLEKEMAKVNLPEEAAQQMRRMLHQKESNYIRLKRAKMDKSMFVKIKTLGVGAFGEVALCRKKDTGMLYAMKTLRKSDVLKRNQVAHVKAERDILAEADNEWVVKLYYSFQDHNNLYFVMDYVPGGDLMGLLIRKEILDEPLARFYVAELVLAIESVHRMGFIHRDIKPDNILIDRDGHIKLTDFGLCTGFRWTHNSKYYQRGETFQMLN